MQLESNSLKITESAAKGQKPKKEQLTIRFSSRQIEEIRELANQTGISTAESARRILDIGLKQIQGEED